MRIKNIIKSTILCIRFPFLYPRNRFTGKHYNNWDIIDRKNAIYKKWYDFAQKNMQLYYDKFGFDAFFKKEFSNGDDKFENNFVLSNYTMKLASMKDRLMIVFYSVIHNILEFVHFIPTYTEIDVVDFGWKKRFAMQLCKDLKNAILKDGGWKLMKSFRIIQIKEKYGELVIYVSHLTPEVSKVIKKYESLSRNVCICCGDDATKESQGYYLPYCDECFKKTTYKYFKYIHPSNDEEEKHNIEVDEIMSNVW